MSKKLFILSFIFLLIPLFIFTDCKRESKDLKDLECEVVLQGSSYLKVINDLQVEIHTDFTAFMPLGATLTPMTCELYGMTAGNKTIVIQNLHTQKEKSINFNIANGETHTITVKDDFFD